MCKYKAVVFDLDGTLLNTINDIKNAGNELLAKYGKSGYSSHRYKQFVGLGVGFLVKSLASGRKLKDVDLTAFREEYLSIYKQRMLETTDLYPGIGELIVCLREAEIRLCVLSNKPDAEVAAIVNHFFPKREFAIVIGNRPDFPAKPDPAALNFILDKLAIAPEEALYIGDTKTDIETAKNAGIASVGVLWGFRPKQELILAGADYIVRKPDIIREIVKG